SPLSISSVFVQESILDDFVHEVCRVTEQIMQCGLNNDINADITISNIPLSDNCASEQVSYRISESIRGNQFIQFYRSINLESTLTGGLEIIPFPSEKKAYEMLYGYSCAYLSLWTNSSALSLEASIQALLADTVSLNCILNADIVASIIYRQIHYLHWTLECSGFGNLLSLTLPFVFESEEMYEPIIFENDSDIGAKLNKPYCFNDILKKMSIASKPTTKRLTRSNSVQLLNKIINRLKFNDNLFYKNFLGMYSNDDLTKLSEWCDRITDVFRALSSCGQNYNSQTELLSDSKILINFKRSLGRILILDDSEIIEDGRLFTLILTAVLYGNSVLIYIPNCKHRHRLSTLFTIFNGCGLQPGTVCLISGKTSQPASAEKELANLANCVWRLSKMSNDKSYLKMMPINEHFDINGPDEFTTVDCRHDRALMQPICNTNIQQCYIPFSYIH
ncbi:hypothetical protein GJ496_008806, partial [Pomphorhynchus laevis]